MVLWSTPPNELHAASIQVTARAARLPGQIRRGANSTKHNLENIQERCVSKMTHRRTKSRTDGVDTIPKALNRTTFAVRRRANTLRLPLRKIARHRRLI